MTRRTNHLLLSIALFLSVGSAAASSPARAGLVDRPLQPYQSDLLDVAFKAASAFPVHPHLKNRARVQELVFDACLELDQPCRARSCAEKMSTWRRGAAYADLAFYGAQHGAKEEAQKDADLALRLAREGSADEDSQDWQVDRIRSKVARVQLWLGQGEQVASLSEGLEPSESGRVDEVRAMVGDEKVIDATLSALDSAVSSGNFDATRNALDASARLYQRFYADAEKRSRIEGKIKGSWEHMPVAVRLDLMVEMIDSAFDHQDPAKALDLVNEARHFVDDYQWTAETLIQQAARLAERRFRAGDHQKARAEADAAWSRYEEEREKIVDIYRAGALRPLAEAYQAFGDKAAALKVYKRAVEEGVHNPNSRPRAEDLAATCCSMAVRRVEPDAELRARLLQVCDGLKEPW